MKICQSEQRMKIESFDAIIIGGGLIGSLMGCLLASKSLNVAIIEKQDPAQTLKNTFDGRTTSISYGSSLIFKEAGVWPLLESQAYPILTIKVADLKGRGFLTYAASDVGNHPMGYMVENRHLRQTLYEQCQALAPLTYFAPMSVQDVSRESFKVRVVLENQVILEAPLLISAEGRQSPLRDKAGIGCRTWNYDQACLVFVAAHEKPHLGTAYEYFQTHGPLATLPLTDYNSAIVWTDKKSVAESLHTLPEEDFNKEMNRRFGDALGVLSLKGQRWVYPLSGLLAKTLSSHRLALVGDAGHAIHPVAGQGMNLGIRDCKALSDLLQEAKDLGGDLGSQTLLQTYARRRKIDNASMAAMTHGLIQLFSNDHQSLSYIRSKGLMIVDRLSFLKRKLARHAMGL